MFCSYCGSLWEPSTGMNSSNYSVRVFCNFYMATVCVVIYRQIQELTDVRLFSEAQDTWWVSKRRFLEKQLAVGQPDLTAVVFRLCRVEILTAFVRGVFFFVLNNLHPIVCLGDIPLKINQVDCPSLKAGNLRTFCIPSVVFEIIYIICVMQSCIRVSQQSVDRCLAFQLLRSSVLIAQAK
jgi:hypothetical protein